MCDPTEWGITIFHGIILVLLNYPVAIYFYFYVCCASKTNSSSTGNKESTTGDAKRSVRKKLNVASQIVFGGYFWFVNLRFIEYTTVCVNDLSNESSEVLLFELISQLGWLIGIFGILFVFIFRLENTKLVNYNSSSGQGDSISTSLNKQIKFSYISIALLVFFSLVLGIAWIIEGARSWQSIVAALVFCVWFLFVYIFLIVTSWKQLLLLVTYKLAKNNNNTDNINKKNIVSASNETVDDNIDIEKVSLIDVTSNVSALVRFTLLICVAFSSTLIAVFFNVFFVSIDQDSDNIMNISDAVWVIDSIINQICICLLFKFSTKIYDKICVIFDKIVKNCVVNKIQIKNQETNETTKQEFTNLIFSQ